MPAPPLLQIDHLSIAFGPQVAVHDLSFTLEAGQTLGLVGESGSGKSATSLAILRLLPATAHVAGKIDFSGQNLLGLSPEAIRRLRGSSIAMIFQEPMTALNPAMKIGTQIAESYLAHHPREPRNSLKQKVLEALHEVALPARLDDYPHQFSGGQRQRILIAMALINRPQLLIADEPTTALDVTVQAQILSLLKDIRRTHALAMLFISHDLAVVAQACDQPQDRIAVMQHGRIVELAPATALFHSPQHPYTRRLLASAPTMHTNRFEPLATT